MSVWEGSITLNSYDWEAALIDTVPDDPIYPYPRLDPARVGAPGPRSYRTIVLENEYTRLTFLPELGGRLYRWLDKPSGREMFYINPVVKPTHWGARGWWLAIGGMEWAFPVEEHGLVEWRPWRDQRASGAGWASVTLSDRDERSRLTVEVTVRLEAGRADWTVRPRIHNPTGEQQSFQFWLNGMFALAPDNRPSPELRFVLPVPSVIVHSTSDLGVPPVGQSMNWPVLGQRDMSVYGSWEGWLGVFAPQAHYMGAYDPLSDMGVLRVFPSDKARGAKIFGPGTIDPATWTDDGSGYVELWGGWTSTFWESATLAPGASVSWQEQWYSVNGLRGVSAANDRAALWLDADGQEVQVGAISVAPVAGQLVLERDQAAVASWNISIGPGAPFQGTHRASGEGTWSLHLLDRSSQPVVEYRQEE